LPIFYQQQVDETTRLGVWKIEETEEFFKNNVPQHRDVTHPHKRLQHLAGRFLLRYLFPDFPYELIQIADTRKPFLPDEQYHFSISHCGDYAAAIVSKDKRVGIDVEIPTEKILRIQHKFLSGEERNLFNILRLREAVGQKYSIHDTQLTTLLWSAKEAVFKWYGEGGVDFSEQIQLRKFDIDQEIIECFFTKNNSHMLIYFREFEHLVLAWIVTA